MLSAKKKNQRTRYLSSPGKSFLALISHWHRTFLSLTRNTPWLACVSNKSRIALAAIVRSRFDHERTWPLVINGSNLHFQLDEYHDRLEDFPEEDEDVNSDDDNNSAPPITKIVPNKLQSKPFKMEVMDF